MTTLAEQTAALDLAIRQFGDLIRDQLLPALQPLVEEMRRIWESWPGMPYTSPSLWDADQMRSDRGR